ncbi:hypothetical protein NDU88_000950 [Pleurodeles waltl]|uniref:Uncharacterized protein n=1 Tax=Pleurodeles waltl TaxID=8319 RepID=A0AAV7WKD3_PLEWA|nr:hypothetical protein NDU88_000950 [Pleurodeles waltl]
MLPVITHTRFTGEILSSEVSDLVCACAECGNRKRTSLSKPALERLEYVVNRLHEYGDIPQDVPDVQRSFWHLCARLPREPNQAVSKRGAPHTSKTGSTSHERRSAPAPAPRPHKQWVNAPATELIFGFTHHMFESKQNKVIPIKLGNTDVYHG